MAAHRRRRGKAREGRNRGRRNARADRDRKSTRLNSSHDQISYAVFCLKKKKKKQKNIALKNSTYYLYYDVHSLIQIATSTCASSFSRRRSHPAPARRNLRQTAAVNT